MNTSTSNIALLAVCGIGWVLGEPRKGGWLYSIHLGILSCPLHGVRSSSGHPIVPSGRSPSHRPVGGWRDGCVVILLNTYTRIVLIAAENSQRNTSERR